MTIADQLAVCQRAAQRRVREATANLQAAKRQYTATPDDPTAEAWLKQACAEALNAQAVGQEMGI